MGARIVVELDDEGRINVSGPMKNKLLCYGLLMAAVDIVREHKIGEAPLVQVARGTLPPAANGLS